MKPQEARTNILITCNESPARMSYKSTSALLKKLAQAEKNALGQRAAKCSSISAHGRNGIFYRGKKSGAPLAPVTLSLRGTNH